IVGEVMPLQDAPNFADRVPGDERDFLDRTALPPPLGNERAAEVMERHAVDPQPVALLEPARTEPVGGPRSPVGIDRDPDRVTGPGIEQRFKPRVDPHPDLFAGAALAPALPDLEAQMRPVVVAPREPQDI